MKHIKSGCGYIIGDNTYTCKGIGMLNDTFKAADPEFEKIPQHIEGFIMTLAPILNMDADRMEVPELACRVELNPFEVHDGSILNTGSDYTSYSENQSDGFLDMYGRVYNDRQDLYFKIDEVSVPIGTSTYSFSKSAVMGPGILEPMVDTSFSPLGVDTITAVDAGLDGLGYSLDVFGQWRDLIESRINSLSTGVNVDYRPVRGLLNLEQAKNKEGRCSNFKISLMGNTTAVIGSALQQEPVYTIAGGTITVNGTTVTVEGSTTTVPTFESYLDIMESTVTPDSYLGVVRQSLPTTPVEGHLKYVYIGSVVEITGSSTFPYHNAESYKLYQIKQGDCIVNVDVNREEDDEYRGPFWVTRVSGRSMKVTGFDGTDQQPKAGKVYVDGTTVTTVGEGTLSADGNSGFVFAHVDLEKTDAGWIYSDCDFTQQEEAGEPAEGHKKYTFRLAAYTVEDNIVDIEQIHYGDLYIDVSGGTTAPGEIIYTGPFHLSSTDEGWGVYGMDNGTAGKVYFNGSVLGEMASGNANGDTGSYVFANIVVVGTTNADSGNITYSLNAENSGYSYTEKSATASMPAGTKIYNIRIGQVASNGHDLENAKQFHYGDIYLYGEENVFGEYNGPFKVSLIAGQTNKVKVTGVETIDNVRKAGVIYLNGKGSVAVPVNEVSSLDLSADGVFLHVFLKKSTTADEYTIIDAAIDSSNQNPSDAPEDTEFTYSVRLALKNGNEVRQTHFGDVYIDEQYIMGGTVAAEYNGPFKVTGGTGASASVTMPAFDGSTDHKNKVGKVLIEVPATTTPSITPARLVGTDVEVSNDGVISDAFSSGALYLHVVMAKGDIQDGKQLYTLTKTAINTAASYSPASGEDAPGKVYTFRLAKVAVTNPATGVVVTTITQIQYGDVYIGDPSDPVITGTTVTYNGPFQLTDDGSIACPVCPDSPPNIAGYYSINGGTEHEVYIPSTLSLVAGNNRIYLNVGIDGGTISTGFVDAPNVYNVLLGRIIRSGTSPNYTYEPKQMHYGNVQVDGRWS